MKKNVRDIFLDLIEISEQTREDVDIELGDKLNVWISIYEDISEIYKKYNDYYVKKFSNSLFLFYFIQMWKFLKFVFFEIYHGGYENALRDLRWILEVFIKTYYIDIKYSSEDIFSKIEKLNKITRLRKKLREIDENEEYIYRVYQDLCMFVHLDEKTISETIKKF